MTVEGQPGASTLRRGVSFLSIVTDNGAWNWRQARERFDSVFAAIRHHRIEDRSEVLCIDNSEHPLSDVESYLTALGRPAQCHYEWCHGFNLLYGLAINRMVKRARFPTVVYFCTNHGRFFDHSWLSDVTAPLADKYCAMAGSTVPADLGLICEATSGYPNIHVQGGMYAARADVLRRLPYSYRFAHVFSDLWITWRVLSEGYAISDVPTIRCTSGERVHDSTGFKYVHDHYV